MTRPVRLGPLPAILFVTLLVFYGMDAVAVVLIARLTGENPLFLSPVPDSAAIEPLLPLSGFVAVVFLVVIGLAIATLIRGYRVQRDTPGRTRVLFFASSSLTMLLLVPVGVVLFATGAAVLSGSTRPFAPRPSFEEILGAVSEPHAAAIIAWLVCALFSLATLLVSHVLVWFLAPMRFRRVVWGVLDVVLTLAFVFVTVTLPMMPKGDSQAELVSAAIRLGVTVAFALRAIVWLLPPTMNLVERLDFLSLVAARHLRARKSSFLAAIGTLSVFAVAVSSCSLTTTLSVMGGFRNDLKKKILGNHAHVTIDREDGPFEGWDPILERVRSAPGVVAASPYVSGEVMVTSATNLSGAVLRGIDPDSIKDVTELERYMRRGKLDYLETPEMLLELSPEDLTGLPPPDDELLPLPEGEGAREGAKTGKPETKKEGGLTREIAALLGDQGLDSKPASDPEPSSASGPDSESDSGPDSGGESGGGSPAPPKPDLDLKDVLEPAQPIAEVLPGVVVGQELARSLRLFVGDEVNIVSPLGDLGPAGPMPKSRPYRVAGIFFSGHYEYDMKYAYVLLSTAQRFLGTGDAIDGIEVKVESLERAPEIAPTIDKAIGRKDLRVRDWQETNKNLFGALALEKLAMFITLGIAILVAGFCVFGTMTLLVQEKSREVAILKAMGTPSRHVIAVFLIEGLLIGLFGASLGLGLGFVAGFLAENFPLFPMNPEVYYIDRLPVHLDPLEFTAVGIASVVICLLATVFPAVLASRLHIVNSLRFD